MAKENTTNYNEPIEETKYIKFYEKPIAGYKTKVWTVTNKNNIYLGQIAWWSAWRQYCFQPSLNCIFNTQCMEDIIKFIETRKYERNY